MLRLFEVFQLAALLLAASIHPNLITFRGEAFVVNELACSRKEGGERVPISRSCKLSNRRRELAEIGRQSEKSNPIDKHVRKSPSLHAQD
jgi:hypothetical protein